MIQKKKKQNKKGKILIPFFFCKFALEIKGFEQNKKKKSSSKLREEKKQKSLAWPAPRVDIYQKMGLERRSDYFPGNPAPRSFLHQP